jgi:hypothetical protein
MLVAPLNVFWPNLLIGLHISQLPTQVDGGGEILAKHMEQE